MSVWESESVCMVSESGDSIGPRATGTERVIEADGGEKESVGATTAKSNGNLGTVVDSRSASQRDRQRESRDADR